MSKFKDNFDEIIKHIEDKGLAGAFDNVMGLTTIDRMIDVLVQTPELKEELHAYIRSILKGMMEFEYHDKEDESLLGYA